ncbi:MAG TPA: arylamine N-acetyltransferase, partial [Acidobacteriota bacterium]|nr:arylamine N-acetyltransferase [Acidobacteriota bacterium]
MMMIIERFKDCYAVRDDEPGLSYLTAIAAAFSHLPYENVTKILKNVRATQPAHKLRRTEEVLQDHLRWKTGGTCFSLCNALQEILHRSGFDSYIAMADMHYGANIHCAVVVRVDQKDYLLDPGYLLHDPIPLPGCEMEVVRQTRMNTVLLRYESPAVFSLYTKEAGQTKWRYRLHATRISHQEFTEHWIHSFSLNS